MNLLNYLQQGKTYIIAEMSANHGGSLKHALEIVRAAKEAGTDCLKIQTYTADTLTIDCDNDYFKIKGGLWDGYTRYELYKYAYTPWEWQADIKAECERIGIDFLSTPFDKTAVDFLEGIGVDAYKIASFELVDLPLIEYAASKGKPMIMSCGMGSIEEIQDAVDTVLGTGNKDIVLLQCTSEYPARMSDMNLSVIPDMLKRFNQPVGLSDHSQGSIGAVVGVSLGACVIEKHFCISRDIKTADSVFSMNELEFKAMVTDIRNAELIKGKATYELTETEKRSLKTRRSLFAIQDIQPGDIFSENNFRSIRPAGGLPPKYYKLLLGKTSKRYIQRGGPITYEDLE